MCSRRVKARLADENRWTWSSLTAALRLLWKPFEIQFGEIRENITKSVANIEIEAELAEKELVHDNRARDDNRGRSFTTTALRVHRPSKLDESSRMARSC
jgi:hypothetical protein